MTSLILHYAGPPEQKHAVKVPPMAPLSSVLLEVCAKLRPAVDAGAVKAAYKDGVLTIMLPKTAEAKPKPISITAE